MKTFYQIHGSNGGTFIFSAASRGDWRKSLEFYRGVSFPAKCKKLLLFLAYPLLKRKANFDGAEFRFEKLEPSCSAMISPTRDKVIIHHHGAGYEKLAFGKSSDGVRGELAVYRLLLEKQPQSFAFSEVEEKESSPGQCRFFMKYAGTVFSEKVPELQDLLGALKEFFLLPGEKTMEWKALWNSLPDDLQKYVSPEEFTGTTPVGLVHRDFKPWNVKSGEKSLFFDFESASFTGCPLEDFFNYTVDPMLRTTAPATVWEVVQQQFLLAEKLLDMMQIPQSALLRLWKWYLLERVWFWRNQEQMDIANDFLRLYKISNDGK